jgi:hypothetical protein
VYILYLQGLSFYQKFTCKLVKLFDHFTDKIEAINFGKYILISSLV